MVNNLFYNRLYEWYEIHHRVLPWRETDNAYYIWLSEIILQQTRVAQGMEYYLRFIARWPKIEELANADEADVLREWQGLGYYSRARNLHKAAKQIVEKGRMDNGQWTMDNGQGTKDDGQGTRDDGQGTRDDGQCTKEIGFPKTFEEIRALPGIGDYTAGAIASFAYNLPYPAMDGNVYRVVARLMDIDEAFDTSAGKKLFHSRLEELLDRNNARLFNSAIMEFGALYCTPTLGDNCLNCPLQSFCAAYAHGTAELLPVRKPRPKVRDRWFDYHVYVCTMDKGQGIMDNGQRTRDNGQWTRDDVCTLIRRREEKDIWYHLYEFPCEEHEKAPSDHPKGAICLTHVLSHQRLHARFIIHKVSELPDIKDAFCVAWQELDDFALSRLTLRALSLISR